MYLHLRDLAKFAFGGGNSVFDVYVKDVDRQLDLEDPVICRFPSGFTIELES
jgi:hypothetical protein